jgi:hypothetical protein
MSLGKVCCPLQGGQHAGEDLEPQVVLVAQAVGAPLDHGGRVASVYPRTIS